MLSLLGHVPTQRDRSYTWFLIQVLDRQVVNGKSYRITDGAFEIRSHREYVPFCVSCFITDPCGELGVIYQSEHFQTRLSVRIEPSNLRALDPRFNQCCVLSCFIYALYSHSLVLSDCLAAT